MRARGCEAGAGAGHRDTCAMRHVTGVAVGAAETPRNSSKTPHRHRACTLALRMRKTSRLRPLLQGTALAGACALSVFAPRIADACSPGEPFLQGTVPVDGATYPANAALLFDGFFISPVGIGVTVDGQPAALVEAEYATGLSEWVMLVEPAPQEGQTVVVSGSFCEGCEDVMITYTAGPPDLAAPQPIAADALFGIYDHADFVSSGGDCQSDSDLSFYFDLAQMPGGESPNFFKIEWDPDGEGAAGFSKTVRASADALEVAVSVVTEQLGGADPLKDLCVQVTAFDAANNAAEPFELCPCFFRKDDIETGLDTPAEPEWTDADGVPGSACDVAPGTTGEIETSGEEPTGTSAEPTSGDTASGSDGTSEGTSDTAGGSTGSDSATAGEGEDDDKGCACSADGGQPGDLGRLLMFALGLGLAFVRRRP